MSNAEEKPEVKALRRRLGVLTEQTGQVRRALMHALTRNHGSSEGCGECALVDTLLDELRR